MTHAYNNCGSESPIPNSNNNIQKIDCLVCLKLWHKSANKLKILRPDIQERIRILEFKNDFSEMLEQK